MEVPFIEIGDSGKEDRFVFLSLRLSSALDMFAFELLTENYGDEV